MTVDISAEDDGYEIEGVVGRDDIDELTVRCYDLSGRTRELVDKQTFEPSGNRRIYEQLDHDPGTYQLDVHDSEGHRHATDTTTITRDSFLDYTDEGLIDRVIDTAYDAAASIPGKKHFRPAEAVVGTMAVLDFPNGIMEAYLEKEVHGEPDEDTNTVSVAWKGIDTLGELGIKAKEEKDTRHGYEEASLGIGILGGLAGAAGVMIATGAATDLPWYTATAATTTIGALNALDRRYGTGTMESWDDIDERTGAIKERVKNAYDTVQRDVRQYWERLWDDDLIERYDVDATTFRTIADELDKHDPEMTYLRGDRFNEPVETVVDELLTDDELSIEDRHLYVERREDTNGERIIAKAEADLNLASSLDTAYADHIDEDTVRLKEPVLTIEATIPEHMAIDELDEDRSIQKASWAETEPEAAVEQP